MYESTAFPTVPYPARVNSGAHPFTDLIEETRGLLSTGKVRINDHSLKVEVPFEHRDFISRHPIFTPGIGNHRTRAGG